MNDVQTGSIKKNIDDAKLQEFAMQTLVAQTLAAQTKFPAKFQALLKPGLIQGIIDAERNIWGINDDFPSIPDAWARALSVMSLPIKGVAEMDDAGWCWCWCWCWEPL